MYSKKLKINIARLMCILLVASVSVTGIYIDNNQAVTAAVYKYGSRGDTVKQIQQALKNQGYLTGTADGIYGSQTRDAVKRFQKKKGLTVDGVAGPKTLSALGISSGSQSSSSGVYKYGSRGDMVAKIQQKLKSLGFLSGSADGVFGAQTRDAVKAFQKSKNLVADGIVGAKTLSALGLSSSGGSTTSPSYSSDVALLARIISAEARGEPYNGQVAVGAVIMNRIKHPSFPNTLSGVIYQNGAFTAIVDGQFNQPIADSAYRAAQDALRGVDPTYGAIYYYNPKTATNQWIFSRPVIIVIGNHRFCS